MDRTLYTCLRRRTYSRTDYPVNTTTWKSGRRAVLPGQAGPELGLVNALGRCLPAAGTVTRSDRPVRRVGQSWAPAATAHCSLLPATHCPARPARYRVRHRPGRGHGRRRPVARTRVSRPRLRHLTSTVRPPRRPREWIARIGRNIEHDREGNARLVQFGWTVTCVREREYAAIAPW